MQSPSFLPPGAVALSHEEMDAAHAMLSRAQELATAIEGHELSLNSHLLDLGQVFHDIIRKNWCRAALGISLYEWVSKNFKNSRGEPMTEDAARFLAKTWKLIHGYPIVEHAVRNGDPKLGQFTCRTSAYFAIQFAELADWHSEAVQEYVERNPSAADLTANATSYAREEVQRRIVALLHKKSSQQIGDDLKALKLEMKKGGMKYREFVRLPSPVVAREVHEQTMAVLARLVDIAGDKANIHAMNTTSILQRLSGFAEDSIHAFQQARLGNRGPLDRLQAAIKENA